MVTVEGTAGKANLLVTKVARWLILRRLPRPELKVGALVGVVAEEACL